MEINPTWFAGGLVLGIIVQMLLFDKWMNLFERLDRKRKTKKAKQ